MAVVACGLLSAGDVRAVTPAVSATESFALALDANGKVYAWGSDADGQLGQGRTLNQGTPTRISGLPPIKSISVNNHVLALDEYGQVWSWGYNSEGQLGARDNAVTTRPDRVIGITGMVRVAAGYDFSVALKADGTVWAWGNLTTGTTFNRALRQVAGLTDIVEISAGFNHLLALRKDGTVWAVGGNDYGQIGNGQVAPGVNDPIQVSGLANVKSISAGVNASLALLANGEIHIWGRTPTSGSMRSPTAVPGLGGAAIAASRETFAGIVSARSDGTVWTYNYTSGNAWAQVAGFAGMSSVVDSLLPARLLLGLDASGRLFAAGANHHGGLGQGNTASYPFQAIAVPGFESTRQVAVSPHTGTVLAIKSDGSVWFWGRDYSGQSGSGASIASSFPLAVAIPASVKTIATGRRFAIAVDTAGNGWGWGFNDYALLDASSSSRSTPLPVSGMTNVSAIAAGGFSTLAFAKSDGTAYSSSGGTPRQMTGLSNIVSVAAGESTTYYLNSSGTAFASGANRFGQLGDGTDVSRSDGSTTTVRIDAPIAKIVAAENRAAALMRDGRVFIWGADFMGNSFTNGTNVPVALGGVTDAVDVAAGQDSLLVRRANGVILAWGNAFFPAPGASAAGAPATVSFGEPVQAMAVASGLAFLVSGTGVAWGWGYSALNTIGGNVGDGTYVFRGSPVVILNAGGSGSLDGNDWFLDLDPSSRDTIPAAAIPKALATAKLFGGNAGLAFEGTVRYKSADLGKRVGNHVLALVPPAFFNLVKTAPGTASAAELAKSVKADQPLVLAQLTPQGWTNVQGQLIALSQGVASSAGAAANILSGVDSAKIPGARFCVGYGESPDGMLSAQSLREVLVVEGTTSTASGVPCVLSGVYVSGPPSSVQSSPVTFSAMVVGISPSGTVQFLDGASSLGSPVTLSAENPAVGRGAFTTSSLSIGTHSIGASYGGDVQNPAATSALPQLHVVSAPLAQTRTDLAGPASSSLGDAVTFIATITGNSPGGQVQFKDAGTNLGAPVPVVGGTASIRLSTLGLGTHSITAVYSGDALNTTGTSSALSHVVANALSASVELTSSTNPSSSDAAITLSVAVSGSNPTGSVTLREGAAVLGSATLSAGRASFTLALLPAGMHVFHADYGGDASNTPATSAALFQQVNVSNSMFGASVRTIVASYYQTILGRTADAAGLEFWAGEAARVAGLGADVREVFFAMSIAFFSSSEYVGRNTTDAQYITDLYRTFFIRDPDAAGLAYWLGELAAVQSRGALLNSFLFSAEFSNQMTARFGASAVRPEVNMTIDLFRGTFGRLPDSAGFNYWLGQIRAAQCGGAAAVSAKVNEVAGLFFNSGEYVARARSNRDFMGDVYNAYLRRGPGGDAAGFGFWVGQLASQTRDQVRAAFVPSAEFQSRVAAVVAAGCSP